MVEYTDKQTVAFLRGRHMFYDQVKESADYISSKINAKQMT